MKHVVQITTKLNASNANKMPKKDTMKHINSFMINYLESFLGNYKDDN